MKNSTLAISNNARRRRATVRERASWVNAWERSGQSQVDFARDHGLRVSTLRRWVRTGASGDRCVPDAVTLQEVDLASILGPAARARAGDWEVQIALPGGVTLFVGREAPATRVRELVEALRC